MKDNTKIFVISGPSGAGKDTVSAYLTKNYNSVTVSPSVTTRTKKDEDNKPDGKQYKFISHEDFGNKIKNHEFLEYSKYCNNYYGTLNIDIEKLLNSGHNVIMILDIDGALSLKKNFPEVVLIFLTAPSEKVLKDRLIKRGRETLSEIEERLKNVAYELGMSKYYDFIINNDVITDAVSEVADIIFCNRKGSFIKKNNGDKL